MLQLFLVALFFLVSGACGLIYENVWVKQISYVFGSTVLATTLVLAAFMAGLALGSATIGARGAGGARSLKVYGWLELGITFSAMAVPVLVPLIGQMDRALVGRVPPALLSTLEFTLLFAVILVPTAMMGATLPVLCRHVIAHIDRPGRAMGVLYALNSIGGVAGGLIAGFWMLENLGLALTAFAAQVLNALVGVAALMLDRINESLEEPAESPSPDAAQPAPAPVAPEPPVEDAGPPTLGRALYTYIFLCGFSAMLFEIALMKVLPLILGSSVHSFSLMVSAFIAGIALGSAAAGAVVHRFRHLHHTLAWLLVLVGLLFLLAMPMVNRLPDVYLAIWSSVTMPFGAFQAVAFGICGLVMFLPSFFLGAVLPVATELLARRRELVADAVGRLYAANTVGNILGTILTGLVLVPRLGFQRSMELGVAIDLVAGIALAWRDPARNTGRALALTAFAAGGVALYAVAYQGLDVGRLTMGVFRADRGETPAARALAERIRGRKVIWSDEDDLCFVSVEQIRKGISMRVNGKVEASSEGDMRTQKLVAHLPLLFHKDPKRVLVIGLGSGITGAAALAHPIEAMECVEISRAVVEAARFFAPWNANIHEHPKATIVVDDGRNYTERAPGGWDVIVSQPSNPWIAGIATLYTREFFQAARGKLKPGGILSQWMHTYETDEESFRTVVRTLGTVFPHVEIFEVQPGDFVMLASAEPLGADLEAVAEKCRRPAVQADLASVRLTLPSALFGLHAVPAPQVGAIGGLGDLNTDDRPVLEYRAPRAQYQRSTVPRPDPVQRAQSPAGFLRRWFAAHPPIAAERILVCRSLEGLDGPLRETMLREALAQDPHNARARTMLGETLFARGDAQAALAELRQSAAGDPDQIAAYTALVEAAMRVEALDQSFLRPQRFEVSLAAAKRLVELKPDSYVPRIDLGTVHYHRQEWDDAHAQLTAGLERAQKDPADALRWNRFFFLMLAACDVERGRFDAARELLARMDADSGRLAENADLEWRVRTRVRAADLAKQAGR